MIQMVIRGRDSIRRAGETAEKMGIGKPLIVGSKHLIPRLKQFLPMEAPVFTGYHPNPDLSDAEAGVRMYREAGCDGLISIGGGSAMDTAKAVKAWLYAGSYEALKRGGLRVPEGSDAAPEKITSLRALKERTLRQRNTGSVPHLAIPGTAGSGAEATAAAVVYEKGKKLNVSHPALLPEGVILDAALLDTLPLYHKKSSALDAFCQGVESYWARAATEDSRVHAFLAFQGVLDNLKGYLAGDPRAAEQMMDASYQSGRAIFHTRTTAAHAMSYQITQRMGLAHGHACALTLPVLWDLLTENEETRDLMAGLASRMRLGDPSMGSRLIRGMMLEMEMPLPERPTDEMLNELTDSVNVERIGNHPMALTRDQIRAVYRRAFIPLPEMEKQACLDIWRYYGT